MHWLHLSPTVTCKCGLQDQTDTLIKLFHTIGCKWGFKIKYEMHCLCSFAQSVANEASWSNTNRMHCTLWHTPLHMKIQDQIKPSNLCPGPFGETKKKSKKKNHHHHHHTVNTNIINNQTHTNTRIHDPNHYPEKSHSKTTHRTHLHSFPQSFPDGTSRSNTNEYTDSTILPRTGIPNQIRLFHLCSTIFMRTSK